MAESENGGIGCLLFILGVACAVGYMKFWPPTMKANQDDEGSFTPYESPADDEKILLASEWQNGGKGRYVEKLHAMKQAYDNWTSPPYHYASSVANEARSAIIKFEQAIGHDDYLKAHEYDHYATCAMRRLKMNRKWRAGISKGTGTHLHSGEMEGTWELDDGYEIVDGRPRRVYRCSKCYGNGRITVNERCSGCNGRGCVENPVGSIGDAVNIVGMFGRRQMPRINVPRTLTCTGCNGRGEVRVNRECDRCNGQGKTYE